MTPEDFSDDNPPNDLAPDSLTDFAWSDAWLLEIYIDRTEPGHRDTVRLVVEWSERQPHPPEPVTVIDFHDCWGIEMEMNFGIIAPESIDHLVIEEDHPKLAKIAEEAGIDDVTCVTLRTSSTGSTIRIFCRAVTMMPDTSYVTLH